MRDLIFGLGFVAIVEGLVLALAPSRLQELAEMLRRITPGQMRFLGLTALAVGVVMVGWAKSG